MQTTRTLEMANVSAVFKNVEKQKPENNTLISLSSGPGKLN